MKFVVLILMLFSVSSYADVISSGEGGFHIKMSISVHATPEQAYQQFLEIGQWWDAEHTWWGDAGNLSLDPTAGGCFCEIAGDKSVQHLTVAYVNPGKEIRLLGGLGPLQQLGLQGVLIFKFIPSSDNDTTIVQEYKVSGYDPKGLAYLAPIVDKVQTGQLRNLVSRFTTRH